VKGMERNEIDEAIHKEKIEGIKIYIRVGEKKKAKMREKGLL
jgi:hypothetical protein